MTLDRTDLGLPLGDGNGESGLMGLPRRKSRSIGDPDLEPVPVRVPDEDRELDDAGTDAEYRRVSTAGLAGARVASETDLRESLLRAVEVIIVIGGIGRFGLEMDAGRMTMSSWSWSAMPIQLAAAFSRRTKILNRGHGQWPCRCKAYLGVISNLLILSQARQDRGFLFEVEWFRLHDANAVSVICHELTHTVIPRETKKGGGLTIVSWRFSCFLRRNPMILCREAQSLLTLVQTFMVTSGLTD